MLRDLLLNCTLILIFVFLIHAYKSKTDRSRFPAGLNWIVLGMMHAVLGTLLYYSWFGVGDSSIMTFRACVYLLAAYFGGPAAVYTAFVLMSVFRMWIGGGPGAVSWDYTLIELVFVSGMCVVFVYLKHFASRWLTGTLLLISFYAVIMIDFQSPSIPILGLHLVLQAAAMLLVGLFVRYLHQNERYRGMVAERDREMLEMLRMQPGFTFKVQKTDGKYEHVLLEGEMLTRLGMGKGSVMEQYKVLREMELLSMDTIEFIESQYDRAWQGESVFFELCYKGRYVLVKLRPLIRDGAVVSILGYGLDISDHREVKRTVHESEERYRTLEKASQDWFIGFDAGLNVLSANPVFMSSLGLETGQAYGRRLERLLTIENAESFLAAMAEAMFQNAPQQTEINILFENDQPQKYRVYLSPMTDASSEERVKAVFRNITEADHRHYDADDEKVDLLALMSHEIRTPLNGIISFSLLLQRTGLTNLQLNYLNKINSSSQSLLNIANDVLDYSKMEAGKMVLERISFSPEAFFRDIADRISVLTSGKQTEVIFDIDPDLPLVLVGDPSRLERVLLNLLNNAIKFTDKGHVLLQVDVRSCDERQVDVSFVVEDTGIGILPEQMEQLFTPYAQGEASTYRKYGGFGLGLVICHGIVESMGGMLRVDSVYGEYSRFSFALTLEVGLPVEHEFVPTYPLPRTVPHVILIEDHELMGNIMEKMLQSFGIRATRFSSLIRFAESGWTAASSRDAPVFVMDMDMEGVGSSSAWNWLLNEMRQEQLRTMGYTHAFSEMDLWREGSMSAPDALLLKPVTRLSLLEGLLSIGEEGDAHGTVPMNSNGSVANMGRGHILVAEDDGINQLAIRTMLEARGYTVTLAGNGAEVMSRLPERSWNLIFMDLHMPEMNGLEATCRIRRMRQYDQTPIIGLTAEISRIEHERCMHIGMNGVMVKPIDEQQLNRVLMTWVRLDGLRMIRGMDTEKVLQRMDGKVHLLQFTLAKFRLEYGVFREKLETLLNHERLEEVKRRIHSLRGVAANLEAHELLNAVLRLERGVADSYAGEEIERQIRQVQDEIDLISDSLPW